MSPSSMNSKEEVVPCRFQPKRRQFDDAVVILIAVRRLRLGVLGKEIAFWVRCRVKYRTLARGVHSA
jgi:hypothetical protein